jgi:hypothetical protein
MVGWFVGQSVDGNQSIWENILESEKKMTRISQRKDRMKLSLPPKLVEKLVWVPVISF